jgi:hypothetical protein
MAEIKTKLVEIKAKPTSANVEDFINKLEEIDLKVLKGIMDASLNRK